MPLNAQEFVLPGFGGGDPSAGLTALSNKLWMRGMQSERLALAKEAKREQAGSFLRQYLEPKDYLSGSAYDPVINSKLQNAMRQGASLAAQGADIPQLLMALGPQMQEITDYSTKAKAVNKQADDAIKTMKESGLVGYDYGRLKEEALKMAFHKKDPKTGQDIGLADIKDVDPSQNYLFKVLQERPDLVTTEEGLDAFVKNFPQVKNSTDATTYTPTGTKTRNKVRMVGQGYLVPETDDKGVLTGMVPAYEHATEGGAPLIHKFTNDEGQTVEAPVRLLEQGLFDQAVSHKGVGDWLRGQVMRHMQEYQDRTGKPVDMNSVQAHQVARAIMYDELKRRSPGSIEYQEELNKPSAAAVNLHLYGDKYQQAYDTRSGTIDANIANGLPASGKAPDPNKPLNAVDTIHQFFLNNPHYLTGEVTNIKGHDVIDVSGNFKGGLLRYAKGQAGAFQHIYFDPQRRVLMTQETSGDTKEYKENELQPFLERIAQANGVNADAVEGTFKRAGYDFKKGTYKNAGLPDDINQRMSDFRTQRTGAIKKGIDDLATNGKTTTLKGVRTADGEVSHAGEMPWYKSGKYYLDIKGDDGAVHKKIFGSKKELEDYLHPSATPAGSSSASSKPASPAATPAKDEKKKEESDEDLLNKYKPK